MIRRRLNEIIRWARLEWRRLLVWTLGIVAGLFLIVQLAYPGDRLLPFTSIDQQSFSMQPRSDAAAALDKKYQDNKIQLYFGSSSSPYKTPTPRDIGLTIDNTPRVESLGYPIWLRLVPTSIFWAHAVQSVGDPTYRHNDDALQGYMTKELGQSCDVAPKDATLGVKDATIIVINSEKGGTCRLDDVRHRLAQAAPRITEPAKVTVPMTERSPQVTDETAKKIQSQITERIKDGVTINANGTNTVIPRTDIIGWLDFAPKDAGIIATINPDRSADYSAKQLAPKVARAPGVSKVATQDFAEISRVDGAPGQAIDTPATLTAIGNYITSGGDVPQVAVKSVSPKVEYTRSYSPTDTGLSALLKQYAEARPGVFGISLVELSGQRRRAVFQDTKQFHTASTYKLYVAYGTLKRVEAGTWRWTDQISGGRNLEKCFDDMIVKSDNPCGEALLAKIGYRAMTDELKKVGLTGTSFLGDSPQTTAGDLSTFNASLESGQLVSAASKDRLLGAMKRNVYRQGIPAGANGTVADKVGFLDGNFHDAAIIYGPNGPAVLSIMTTGSSWATIADLTRQIEALRSR